MENFKIGSKIKTVKQPTEKHDQVGTHGIISAFLGSSVEVITFDSNGKWFSVYDKDEIELLQPDEKSNLPDIVLA